MAFDVGKFWKTLEEILQFVHARFNCGQTDAESSKINSYLLSAVKNLREAIPEDPDTESMRLHFWTECKGVLEKVYDDSTEAPRGSVSLTDFYRAMAKLQHVALKMSSEFWLTTQKPSRAPFDEEPPPRRQRSRSPHAAPRHDPAMGGRLGVFQWLNPPEPLCERPGFWIFYKKAYWLCDTPPDPSAFDTFQPCGGKKRVDGNLTMWMHEKYKREYPFLEQYDFKKGLEYGLLQRLDRETSGPVVVVKNEEAWWKLKQTRDEHSWHKEYVCLVHGRIPPDKAEGVLDEYSVEDVKGKSNRSRIVQDNSWDSRSRSMPKKLISVYQVLEYFTGPGWWSDNQYTLVKVRILTGRRHQIRVQMSNLMWNLQQHLTRADRQSFGIVSDFIYLNRWVCEEDQQHLCERVFLHAMYLGMWDPEDNSKLVSVKCELPQELQACLGKLCKDEASNRALREHREWMAGYRVEAFCQKYRIGPLEKQDLNELDEPLCKHIFAGFEKCAGELEKLSIFGDHSFLMGGILKNVKRVGKCDEFLLENILESQVYERLRKVSLKIGTVCTHESGRTEKRRPVPDDTLPDGWTKLEMSQGSERYLYYHAGRRITQQDRPVKRELPPGWDKMKSRSGQKEYFLHRESGTTQLGWPCPGEPEELPPNWEKTVSERTGRCYYFNRETGAAKFSRPMQQDLALPEGWSQHVSSAGRTYFFHAASGVSQYDRPEEQAASPFTPPS